MAKYTMGDEVIYGYIENNKFFTEAEWEKTHGVWKK